MKIEARRNTITLALQSNDVESHALMTDMRPHVEATMRKAADWFEAEVQRLLALADSRDPLAEFTVSEPK